MGETTTQISARLVISREKEANKRKSLKRTHSLETMKMSQVLGLVNTTTAVCTTTLQTRIVKRMAEQGRQAGWRIGFLRTTLATTICETPRQTMEFIFETKTLMAAQ